MSAETLYSLRGLSICIVGINYAPDSTGIAPYTTAMARAFIDAGAEVHVVTGLPHYPEWRLKDVSYRDGSLWVQKLDGIQVTRVSHAIPSSPGLLGRVRMEASFLWRATLQVRRDPSDLVVAVTPSLAGLAAGVLAKKSRPFGVVVQDLTGNGAGESGTTGRWISRCIAAIEYGLLRKADRVSVITSHFAEVLRTHGVRPNRIVETPNFAHIAVTKASKSEARAQLGWLDNENLVVHTGNMGMKQGLEHVVSAAKIADQRKLNVVFVLLGDGNQRASLEIAAQGVESIRFIDPLGEDEYPLALAAADILLLNEKPGVKEMSLPSKLTSYTGVGRPIIAAVEPGGITHKVITADSAAHCIQPGQPEDLISAVTSLLEEDNRAAALGLKAIRMHEERYSKSAALRKYIEFAQYLGRRP